MATSSTFKNIPWKKKRKKGYGFQANRPTERGRSAESPMRKQHRTRLCTIRHKNTESLSLVAMRRWSTAKCQESSATDASTFSLSVEIILSIFHSSKVSEPRYRCYIPAPWLWLERFCRPVLRWLQKLFAALGLLFGLSKERSVGFKGILNKNMWNIVSTYYYIIGFKFLMKEIEWAFEFSSKKKFTI